jgi:hypothetical protein
MLSWHEARWQDGELAVLAIQAAMHYVNCIAWLFLYMKKCIGRVDQQVCWFLHSITLLQSSLCMRLLGLHTLKQVAEMPTCIVPFVSMLLFHQPFITRAVEEQDAAKQCFLLLPYCQVET